MHNTALQTPVIAMISMFDLRSQEARASHLQLPNYLENMSCNIIVHPATNQHIWRKQAGKKAH